jgi:hypothetical protein
MESWTPLFSSIVAASIWGEPLHVRVVWITLIAMKDKKGFVSASVPGLARLANVTREQCEDALARFEREDPDSKCQEHGGVKLKRCDGGWMILGHERNIEKMQAVSKEIARIKAAARQARYEANKKKRGLPLAGENAFVKAEENGHTEYADRLSAGEA